MEEGLADQAQILAAWSAWKSSRLKAMGEILVEQGVLDTPQRARLEGLAAGHCNPGERSAELSLTVAYEGRDAVAAVDEPRERGRPDSGAGEPTSAERRFEILRSHARGGLGEVFLALDRELNRQVALKELQPYHAHNPASQSRFVLEAEVTGRLEHPGIVPVYGLGRYPDGRPYYAMRYIEGETLKAAIQRFHGADRAHQEEPRERELAFQRLLHSLIAACNAVAYAHSRGVVHRDIKPENIMLGPFGETLVVDWGVAKTRSDFGGDQADASSVAASESDSSLTRPGAAVGTPRYMSPEQALGEIETVGPPSDVYGLGATLYCLLVGHAPFPDGDVTEVLDRVGRGIFPSPRRLVRALDPALEAICLKAMSLKPKDRYASPLDMAEAIEAWLADLRHRGEHVLAHSQVKRSLARLCIERAHHFLDRERFAEGMLWLARALENVPADSPGLERAVRASLGSWHARSSLMERSLSHKGDVRALAFSPDGHRLATASASGAGQLWDVATAAKLGAPLSHEAPLTAVAFSPQGDIIATSDVAGMLKLWDALTGRPLGPPLRHGGAISAIRFAPGGSSIGTACRSNVPCLWSALKHQPIHHPEGDEVEVLAVAFSPDGKQLATARDDGNVVFWRTSTGQPIGEPLVHPAPVRALAFRPDGKQLLTGYTDGKARLWNLDQAAVKLELSLPGGATLAEFSPAGDVVATASDDGSARLWNPDKGHPIGESLSHRAAITCLAFSPDGTLLATGSRDRTVRFWDTETALPIGPPLDHRGVVCTLAFSPDGRRLATGSSDGLARYWKAAPRIPGEIERISCWVRVTTELDFDEGDALRKLDPALGWELRRRLHELGGPPPKKVERW
jgi:WD40 repeat protein